ncbi:MAG: endonuclease [Candidatus Nealsonbacteria bacterium]|nr:endonuclease [Candidatus Nealsonbacteria bacterium]
MNRAERQYRDLLDKHGQPQGQWRLWCKRPKNIEEKQEVMIGAVLTQNTNWNNAEQAIFNLKENQLCNLRRIYQKDKKIISELIRPSRFYKQKTDYLCNLSEFVIGNKGVRELEKHPQNGLRKKLLSVKGLGKETADSILLYALEKPVFVIDAYTKRFVKRKSLTKNLSYNHLQNYFEQRLPKDYALFQDFHALIVIEG